MNHFFMKKKFYLKKKKAIPIQKWSKNINRKLTEYENRHDQ